MAEKVIGLRLFGDAEGKMNLALADVDGAVLVVSQFTLYGDAEKGRRPSFIDAARPEQAIPLYERFVARAARTRPARGDRRVRRHDGRRTRERRTRHALARAMSESARVEVILASQSPRRRELLTLIGIPHVVRPADIDESVLPGEEPVPHAERLAREKAHRLAERHPDAVVIAADTIVVLDGEILGKPADAAEARATLARLSGRTHTVYTAIAVARDGRTESAVEAVVVTFRALGARRDRRLRRDRRADGQGRRLRHPGVRRDDRRADRGRLLQRDGARAAPSRRAPGASGLRYEFAGGVTPLPLSARAQCASACGMSGTARPRELIVCIGLASIVRQRLTTKHAAPTAESMPAGREERRRRAADPCARSDEAGHQPHEPACAAQNCTSAEPRMDQRLAEEARDHVQRHAVDHLRDEAEERRGGGARCGRSTSEGTSAIATASAIARRTRRGWS